MHVLCNNSNVNLIHHHNYNEEFIMPKSIISFTLIVGLAALGFSQAAFAGQKTTRTGPKGNSEVTNRSYGNGQQNTTRTSPKGNSEATNRSYGNGQETTIRTGPKGKTQTTNRSVGN
jgi:hypothetical protein